MSDTTMKEADILGAVARGWCHPKNSHKVMDSDLACAIAEEVRSLAEGQPAAASGADLHAGWQQLDDLHIDSWGRGQERAHAHTINGQITLEVTNGDEVWRAAFAAPWVNPVRHAAAELVAAASEQPAQVAGAAVPTWRCFHCDEVFADENAARDHFGPRIYSDPACTINAAEYRRMEEVHHRHCEEDTDLHRQIHALAGRVDPVEVRRAEEKGYAAGLRDGVNLPADSPERAALSKTTGSQP